MKNKKLYSLTALLIIAFTALAAGATVTWVFIRTYYEPSGYDWENSYVVYELPEFIDAHIAFTGDQYIGHPQAFTIEITNMHDQGMTLMSYDLSLDYYDYHESPYKWLENIYSTSETNSLLITETNTYADSWTPQNVASTGYILLQISNCVWLEP